MSAASVAVDNFKARMEHRTFLIGRRTYYRQTYSTEPGQLTLKDLRKFCKMGQDIMVPGDPHATSYNVGMQRVYLHIEGILKTDSDTIDKLSGENQ